MDNHNNPMMNQTRRELIEIAKAENVPYSKRNKAQLIERIQQYRDTVGTLYRESKSSLKKLAKTEGVRGYGSLIKSDLIDTILYHRRVVKPQIDDLSRLGKGDLKRLAREEGLEVVGSRKDRIAQNIVRHRVFGRRNALKDVLEDVVNEEFKPVSIEGAFEGNFIRFRSEGVEEDKPLVSIEQYMKKVKRHVLKNLSDVVKTGDNWKVQLNVAALFRKVDGEDEGINPIWSTPHVIMRGTDLEEVIEDMYQKILGDYETLSQTCESSNYVFVRIVEMTYHCHKVDMNRGSSYVDLPDWIYNKNCCINPKNEDDDECFKWAVTVALHHNDIGKNCQRISKIKSYTEKYNWSGIKFPTPSNQWKKFESQNPDVALNVLSAEGFKIRQAYISKRNSSRKCVDLLIVKSGDKEHYVAIKSLSRLLRGVTSTNNGDFYCRNCLGSFRTKNACEDHFEACKDHDFCYVKMPEEGSILKYQEGSKSIRVPFVIYADTESILRPIQGADSRCTCNDPECVEEHGAFTRDVNEHVGCGVAMLIKFAHGEYERAFKQCRGEDAITKFCKTLKVEVERAIRYRKKAMYPLTDDEKRNHRKARECHLCKGVFVKSELVGDQKVRDHCHYTGKYRGAAHSKCNLAHRIPKHIPVVFHNLSGYDAHVIIRELAEQFVVDEMEVLAENAEKYISFSVPIKVELKDDDGKPIVYKDKNGVERKKTQLCKLRFIDSNRFMQSSLGSLVDNLAGTSTDGVECCGDVEFVEVDEMWKAKFECEKCHNFQYRQLNGDVLKTRFSNLRRRCASDGDFRLFLRKGIYPYEYMDSFDRFEEVGLPPVESFYSELTLSGVSKNDYTHAQKVYEALECRDLGDYHDAYLCSDVLLLADVFENFRDTCHEHYGLDPAHFYSAPGLAWQGALKMTSVELELLTDKDMLLMFEKGIRGGMCQTVLHHAKANNLYMGGEFKKGKPSSYLAYLDANNLYGVAMCDELPTHGFRWVENPDEVDVLGYEGGEDGYVLEVDVEYPKRLHNKHNELPFLPEKMRLGKVEKLVCNLYDKFKYPIHIKALKQAMEHGLILKKVHRAIAFKQSAWLKPYIDFNTRLRTAAKNDFGKNFFKLMNNSVFGKTMENVRRHKNIKLACSERKRKFYASKVNYRNTIRFSDKLLAMDMRRVKVEMNKPVYLGLCILDLSKIIMYGFHYDYMKPKYEHKAELMYMDTDSLVYHIKTEDFYRDIAGDVEERFDTSNYSKDDKRPLQVGVNKKKLGVMKDELGGKIMTEFIGLRPKMYAYQKIGGEVDKRCKGTKKCVVKKRISFEDYKNCYETGRVQHRVQHRFASRKHVVYTQKINKVALSIDDDKRIQDRDGNKTYAHGTSVGVVCKDELMEKTWHPDRVAEWCFDEGEKEMWKV